jgi:hypothetical protein
MGCDSHEPQLDIDNPAKLTSIIAFVMQKDVETVTLRVNAQFVFPPFPGRKQNFPFRLTHFSGGQAPALKA